MRLHPIAAKIYGLAILILALLAAVTAGNYLQMRRVNIEIEDLAERLAPMEKSLARVVVADLELELHCERILRILAVDPRDERVLELGLEELRSGSERLARELADAASFALTAATEAKLVRDAIEFARLETLLGVLREDQRILHEQTMKLIEVKRNGLGETDLFATALEHRRQVFDRRLADGLRKLQASVLETTRQIDRHERNLVVFNRVLTTAAAALGLALAGYR